MDDNKQVPITVSREDLYELVWSKPMLPPSRPYGSGARHFRIPWSD
jgi:hypothetical protein